MKDLELSNKQLTNDNEFLKGQLKELTGFLEVLVGCIERQNHCSMTSQKVLQKESQINDVANNSFTANASLIG